MAHFNCIHAVMPLLSEHGWRSVETPKLVSEFARLGVSLAVSIALASFLGALGFSVIMKGRFWWIAVCIEVGFLALSFVVYFLIGDRRAYLRIFVFGLVAGFLAGFVGLLAAEVARTGRLPPVLDKVSTVVVGSQYIMLFVGSLLTPGWIIGGGTGLLYQLISRRKFRTVNLIVAISAVICLARMIVSYFGRRPFNWQWYDVFF